MCDEDVLRVGTVAAQFSVEVRTAVAQSAIADYLHHGLCKFVVVDWELVGVPSVLSVATVGIDRTEHAVVYSHSQFVLEGVTGKSSVVNLNVHLEILVQTMCTKESNDCLGVHVILVLGRLHRLRFDKECTLKSVGTGIVASNGEHLCEVFLLALLVGIEQRHVALASAPEHIVGAAKLDCGVDGVLYLYGSTSHNIEVRISCSSVHIALVGEHIGCTPQQLDVGALHLLKCIVGDGLHVSLVFGNVVRRFYEVDIVEAEVFDAKLLHYLKSGIHLVLGTLQC